jgi:ferredoxin-NADP reductase
MSMPRKLRCTVQAILDHGEHVYTVDLTPSSPVPPFRPGQFLHLTVDEYDPSGFWPESRVFSIASSPRDRGRLRLCYAVKGRYTTRMEQRLRVGGEVWIKLPYGEFVIDPATAAVLLAGGTGISAFTAFLQALTTENQQRVCLIYGARAPELLLYRDCILDQSARVPHLEVVFFTEAAEPAFSLAMAALPKAPLCLPGRIDLDKVWPRLHQPTQQVFYLSGPPIMLGALGDGLVRRGVPPAQIRTDAWQ